MNIMNTAFEVTTIWRYRNMCIVVVVVVIIIIIIVQLQQQQ